MPRALALLLLLGAVPARAYELSTGIANPHQLITELGAPSAERKELTVFPEHLVYEVRWGLLRVGYATLAVDKLVSFAGRPAYQVVSEATSNSFCDKFYKVRDINESWIDARRFVSLGYSKKLREGHFFRDEWTLFDSQNRRFLAKTTDRDGQYRYSGGTTPVSVQDVLSSLYYVRSQPLEIGRDIVLDVNTKNNWPLVVRVLKKEKIKTPAGTFDAVLVEPAIREEGIFIQKGKRLRVWLADDAKKTPVLIMVEVFFGHVTATLSKML